MQENQHQNFAHQGKHREGYLETPVHSGFLGGQNWLGFRSSYVPLRVRKFHDHDIDDFAETAEMLFEPILCGIVVQAAYEDLSRLAASSWLGLDIRHKNRLARWKHWS